MFVPTAETSSLRFFLDMMVDLRKPIMFVGGAGVGKTQLVKGKLSTLSEDCISLSISFNYFTDVTSFQKVGLGSRRGRVERPHPPFFGLPTDFVRGGREVSLLD